MLPNLTQTISTSKDVSMSDASEAQRYREQFGVIDGIHDDPMAEEELGQMFVDLGLGGEPK